MIRPLLLVWVLQFLLANGVANMSGNAKVTAIDATQYGSNHATLGMGTLLVKRPDTPDLHPYRSGCFERAVASVQSRSTIAAARGKLRAGKFAKTTLKTRASKACTVQQLTKAGKFTSLPVTAESLETVAAALKAGHYHSGGS